MATGSASSLVEEIESRVRDGALRPGDRLPSVREHALAIGLAPNTVAAAYRRLRERGVVVGKGRQGTVVAERPLVTPVVAHGVPVGAVDAMSGNPDSALLPNLSPAMTYALECDRARYGDSLVNAELALAGRHLFEADAVEADHMTVVSGAMDAIERLLTAHLRQGDPVGVEDPGYASVHQLVSGLGYRVVPIAVDDEGMRPEAFGAAIDNGLAAVIVTPRSSNPTGAAFTQERAQRLSDILSANPDVFVLEDDHAGPVAGVEFVGVRGQRRRWATIKSASKSLGPDLRAALVAGDRDTIDRVEGRLQVGPGWVSQLLQITLAYLLDDSATQEMVNLARDSYTHRRNRMTSALRALGVAASARSGLQVWVPVPDEQAVVMAMLERGFAVRAGDIYRLQAPPAIRITTAALDDHTIDALAVALAEVLGPHSATTRIA